VKVAYVNGLCVQHDAISNSVAHEIRTLQRHDLEVKLFAYACDQRVPFQPVERIADIATAPDFLDADLVVFHFGIYYPLFDLLPLVPSSAKRLVVFHNVTPPELVPEARRDVIHQSFAQLSNMAWAHHVVCDSETNLRVLRDAGVRTPASVIPVAVDLPADAPQDKPSFNDDVVRLLFVGRFVEAKGALHLVEVVRHALRARADLLLRLDMLGNIGFSEPRVVEQLKAEFAQLREAFGSRVELALHGNGSDELKARLLADADLFVLPSYHEGFCVPVVEAIASGCRVVTYDNSNLPAISGGLSTLVPTGALPLLCDAALASIDEIRSVPWRTQGYAAYVEQASRHVAGFSPTTVSDRFMRLVGRLLN